MDPGRSTGDRSGNSGNYNQEVVGNLQFGEEVPSLVTENLFQQCFESSPESGSYFTALLGLPANEARELLHEPESGESSVISSAAEVSRDQTNDKKTLGLSFACSPTFPSNAALVERAARFSIFATGKESPETSSMPSNSGENLFKLKNEQTDADSNHDSSQRGVKRKEREKNKGKVPAKKSKNTEEGRSALGEEGKGGEQLPYVHVRARRGQATDSHSLAERARREKINARMKLLQELVPGCNKISGTALVLEEIINHVQSLQRQVEILSMRLATVNPRIDFRGLDNFLSPQNGFLSASNGEGPVAVEPSFWTQLQVNEARQQQHQQLWAVDLLPPSAYERDNNVFITPETSLFSYDSANSGRFNSSLQRLRDLRKCHLPTSAPKPFDFKMQIFDKNGR